MLFVNIKTRIMGQLSDKHEFKILKRNIIRES